MVFVINDPITFVPKLAEDDDRDSLDLPAGIVVQQTDDAVRLAQRDREQRQIDELLQNEAGHIAEGCRTCRALPTERLTTDLCPSCRSRAATVSSRDDYLPPPPSLETVLANERAIESRQAENESADQPQRPADDGDTLHLPTMKF